ALGWAVAVGLACGLFGALFGWLMTQTNSLTYYSDCYDELPSLKRPLLVPTQEWNRWLETATMRWLGRAAYYTMALSSGAMGFLTWLLVRPKNRGAEIGAGLLAGFVAACITFFFGGGWYIITMTAFAPGEDDLWVIIRDSSLTEGADPM